MSQSTKILMMAGGALVVVVAIGAGILGPFLGQRQTGPGSSAGSLASGRRPVGVDEPDPAPTPSPTFAAPDRRSHHRDGRDGGMDRARGIAVDACDRPGRTDLGALERERPDPDLRPDREAGREVGHIREPGTASSSLVSRLGPERRRSRLRAGRLVLRSGFGQLPGPAVLRDRQFVRAFGSYGSEPGQFASAVAIGLDDGGNLYVSDAGRHDVQVFTTGGTYVRTVAKGAAGDGLWGSGPGWFITTRRTDGGPGMVEYHSDGTVQGGWDLSQWSCEPSGVTRDQAPRNIYVTCPSPDGGISYLFRFDQTGTLLRAWNIEGAGIAVTPEGTAAFIVVPDGTSLSRVDLDPPTGG